MKLTPVRFSSSVLLDGGGSGWRLDVAMDNGQGFPDMSCQFRGAVNARYAELPGEPTLEKMFTLLADRFIDKRLASAQTFRTKPDEAEKTVKALLEAEPIKRVFVSTAGQIKAVKGKPQITAADNLPGSFQNVDFLGEFRRVFADRLQARGLGHLLDRAQFQKKGWIFNDALAGVMAMAREQEVQSGKPLTKNGPSVIMLDVGSGIATGGINGNRLFTAETQNARVLTLPGRLAAPAADAAAKLQTLLTRGVPKGRVPRAVQAALAQIQQAAQATQYQSFEDVASMRGMAQNAVHHLRLLSLRERRANPTYQQIAARAVEKEGAKSADQQAFKPTAKAFDRFFDTAPEATLKTLSWKNRWLDEQALIARTLDGGHDPVAKAVMNDLYDGLAALASAKVMEHKARKVYLQFIDMDKAVEKVNADRSSVKLPPIANPLMDEVNRRMWEKYLHVGIAKTCLEPNAVERLDVRNMEGTGYLAQVFGAKRKGRWQLDGVDSKMVRQLV